MTNENQPASAILPGATIGILGSGQLGRMMAIAAKHMGYRIHVLSSELDSPTGQVADLEVQGTFAELDAVEAFAKQVDVVTAETENVPLETLDTAAQFAPSFPGRKALQVCQNRSLEKSFLVENGIPTCQFRIVRSQDELAEAW